MYQIDKTFEFCYGHRVWTQKLDFKYSVDTSCACRHLHGHQGTVKIGLESSELKESMVTDFKHLNCIKYLIDIVFDHKFFIDMNDPQFNKMFSLARMNNLIHHESKLFSTVDLNKLKEMNIDLDDYEVYEGLVIVPFVPTSENLCKFLAQLADFTLKGLEGYGSRFKLSYIDFWETPKSHCRYTL